MIERQKGGRRRNLEPLPPSGELRQLTAQAAPVGRADLSSLYSQVECGGVVDQHSQQGRLERRVVAALQIVTVIRDHSLSHPNYLGSIMHINTAGARKYRPGLRKFETWSGVQFSEVQFSVLSNTARDRANAP